MLQSRMAKVVPVTRIIVVMSLISEDLREKCLEVLCSRKHV